MQREPTLSTRKQIPDSSRPTASNQKEFGTDTVATHLDGVTSETLSSTNLEFDYLWFGLDQEWDAFFLSLDRSAYKEATAQRHEFVEGLDSLTISPLFEGIGLPLFPDTRSMSNEDKPIGCLDKELSSATMISSHWPLLEFGLTTFNTSKVITPAEYRLSASLSSELQTSNIVLTGTASQSATVESSNILTFEQTSQESGNDPLVSPARSSLGKSLDTDRRLSISLRTARSTTLSVASLRQRLSNATDKYSQSTLEDIVSIMDHYTISTSSSASVAPSRLSNIASSTYLPTVEKEAQVLDKAEYSVILPGAFPEYCWEQIINNKLSRCDRGHKYRKARIC